MFYHKKLPVSIKENFIIKAEIELLNSNNDYGQYGLVWGFDKEHQELSNLRKTYLTWHHQVLGDDTGLVSSHSTTQVLEKYYLDPKVLTAVEISALKVRVFGKK